MDPFLHSENSLHQFLRHQGVVREAKAFNYLPSPQAPASSTKIMGKNLPKDKKAKEHEAIQGSEKGMTNDLFLLPNINCPPAAQGQHELQGTKPQPEWMAPPKPIVQGGII